VLSNDQQYEANLFEKLIERADVLVHHLWVLLLQALWGCYLRKNAVE